MTSPLSRHHLILWISFAILAPILLVACSPSGSDTISHAGPAPPGAQARFGKGVVRVMAVSPDGDRFVVGTDIGIFLINADTYEELWSISASHLVMSLAFSPESNVLAAGLENGAVTLVDTETGDILDTSLGPQPVSALTWSPRGPNDEPGEILAVGLNDGSGILFLVNRDGDDLTIEQIALMPRIHAGVSALAFSPNGRILASGNRMGLINIWDGWTGDYIFALQGHVENQVITTLEWSHTGEQLVSGAADDDVIVWDIVTGSVHGLFTDHKEDIIDVALDEDGTGIVSVAADGSILRWDYLSFEAIEAASDVFTLPLAGALSASGETLITAGTEGNLDVWALPQNLAIRQATATVGGFLMQGADALAMDWSPDGTQVASSSGALIQIWDTEGTEVTRLLGAHTASVNSLAWSPDGERLASGSRDGTIIVWNMQNGRLLFSIEGAHEGLVADLAISPDGTMIASAGGLDSTAIIWDAQTGDKLHTIVYLEEAMWAVDFSPDGETFATGTEAGHILLWNLADEDFDTPIDLFQGHISWIAGIDYSPDGSLIASSSADTRVVVWDVETGEDIHRLPGHTNVVRGVAFSADGSLIASGSQDRLVIVWEVGGDELNPEPIHVFGGHSDGIDAIAFSPTDDLLATSSDDGTVILWDVSE